MKQRSGKAWSMPGGIGLGVASAMAWTVVTAIMTGILMDTERLAREWVGYASIVILVSSAWMGSCVAYSKIQKQKVRVSVITGMGYFLSLLAATALFFGGSYRGMGVTALMIACGSGLEILAGNRVGQGRRRKRPQKTRR